MSFFSGTLKTEKIGKRRWRILEEFTYYIDKLNGEHITVEEGFETDLASIPDLFFILLPPVGLYDQAAVLHDKLYSRQGMMAHKHYTREECDRIFLQAMNDNLVVQWKREIMYSAVRLFGQSSWNNRD